MKLVLTCIFLCFHLISQGQDYYIKSNPNLANQNQNLHIESLPDGSYVTAGYGGAPFDSTTIFVKKFNKCGTALWAKEISHASDPLDLVELNIDSNKNIIIVGRKGVYNQSPLPYILKIDQAGTLIYSKLLSSTLGYNSLIYSCSIAPNGDYNLFGIHRYTASPPNNHKYYVARLSSSGTLKWAKNLSPAAFTWGRASATRDGGIIGEFGRTIFKLDSLGIKEWAKNYTNFSDLITPTETDSGFVFARYFIGAIDRGSLFSIRHDGSVQWATKSFFNFYPFRGITRKNGNVLFPGNNHFNSNSAVFLEVDPINGSIVKHQEIRNSTGYFATDLSENKDEEIVFVGPDNRGFAPQLLIGKLNDTLSTLSCLQDSLIGPSDPFTVSVVGDNPLTITTNTDLTTSNFQVVIRSKPIFNSATECAFTKPRGSHLLGADTILCRGQSLTIGNANSSFDSYLWSSNSTNKTIALNQSGTYWLQVVSACDTLRDSINVSILPGILFSIGPDTTVCSDTLILGEGLNPASSYVWSTGDSTRTITVRTTGYYWVENINKCHTTRDSIYVEFKSPYAPINLGNDTILCPKQGFLLGDLNSPYDTFDWSDGSSDKTLQVTTAGSYWLHATEACGTSKDTIHVDYYPNIGLELGNDTSICAGDLLVLGVSRTLNNYQWSTGASTPSIVVSAAGIYWLETQTICGPVRDSITVSIVKELKKPILPDDSLVCKEQSVILSPGILANYRWSDGSITPLFIAKDSGLFWVETKNRCDTLRDSVQISYHPSLNFDFSINPIEAYTNDSITFINNTIGSSGTIWNFGNGVKSKGDSVIYQYKQTGTFLGSLTLNSPFQCTEKEEFSIRILASDFHIPTVFTPNQDGINDQFFPVGRDIKKYTISMFNTWGIKIHKTAYGPWNGVSYNGTSYEAGSYVYIMHIEFYNGEIKKFVGQVNLIR